MLTTAGPTRSTTSTTAREYASSASASVTPGAGPGARGSGGGLAASRLAGTVEVSWSRTSSRTSASWGIPTAMRTLTGSVKDASAEGGELDHETGAAAELTLDVDVALVALDDPLHDREAEARAVVLGLRGEERREDLRKVVLGDPGAVVFDLDDDA